MSDWVKGDYLPDLDDLRYRAAGLVTAWGIAYALAAAAGELACAGRLGRPVAAPRRRLR